MDYRNNYLMDVGNVSIVFVFIYDVSFEPIQNTVWS